MWYSPLFLEEYSRSLTRELELRRPREEHESGTPSRWRRLLARRLVSLGVRLDDREACATLAARFSPR